MTRSIVVDDVDVVADFGDVAREVDAIRGSIGLSHLRHVTKLRVAGEGARSFLDRVLAGDLFLRDGQVRQTLILAESGEPLADAYVCNDDDRYFVFAEGMPRHALLEHLRAHQPKEADVVLEDLSESHAIVSINGPFAWELMAALEGPGVIGFPYLSFYHAAGDRLYLRAGKTGEFGYDLLVPTKELGSVTDRLLDVGRRFDLKEVGIEALWRCALENWFFNPHRHRAPGVTPVELQLQWRVSHRKEYVGSRAITERRTAGPLRRATGLTSRTSLAPGDVVTFEGARIGTIVDAHQCPAIERSIAMAMLDLPFAQSGIDRYSVDGKPVRTISPPFVNNLSLYLNPQKDSYVARADIAFPGAAPDSRGA